jgi:DNA-binding NarL/FixJ family response regulator
VALIRSQPEFRVLAASAEIEEALQAVLEVRPDVVLMDLGQRSQDRLTLAGALHGKAPGSRVVVMGIRGPDEDLLGLVRARVSGFIMAGASFESYLATIHAVARGQQTLPLELIHALFGQLSRRGEFRRKPRSPVIRRLTHRERAVAGLIGQGLSNRAIAARLQIAVQTVKGHVHKVLSKLAVNSRLDVAAFSERGEIPGIDLQHSVPVSPT